MHAIHPYLNVQALSDIPFALLMCLVAPIVGFNFNDAADFVIPILIVATLAYLVYRHALVPDTKASVRFASRFALWLAILAPLAPLLALYLMSWRATIVLGHWPMDLADDPKHICLSDALFQELDCAEAYATAFAGWALVTWAALILHLRRSVSIKYLVWQAAIFLSAWAAFACEPTQRFSWWLG